MAENGELFADGIGQIHFAGNMVRFDFMTLQPGEDGKAPVPQNNIRIVMPPQGFLSAFNSMQQLIDKLVEAGQVIGTIRKFPAFQKHAAKMDKRGKKKKAA